MPTNMMRVVAYLKLFKVGWGCTGRPQSLPKLDAAATSVVRLGVSVMVVVAKHVWLQIWP